MYVAEQHDKRVADKQRWLAEKVPLVYRHNEENHRLAVGLQRLCTSKSS